MLLVLSAPTLPPGLLLLPRGRPGDGLKAVGWAACRPRSLRSDYAFYADGISCRDFWQASGPKQTQPPITAWRQAFKQTLEAGIQSAKVAAKVASISVVCNDPPPEFSNDLRRVSLTAQLTPDLIFNDLALVSPAPSATLAQ